MERRSITRRLSFSCVPVILAALVASIVGVPRAEAVWQEHQVIVNGPRVSKPAIASQSSGASLLAWPQLDGASWRIAAQRIGSGGVPVANPRWISAPGGSSSSVAVALSPAGDGVIGWKQEINGIWQIRLRRWWASGSLGPIMVISSPRVTATYVAVTIAVDRTVIAVWEQRTKTGCPDCDGIVRAVRWRAGSDPEISLRLQSTPQNQYDSPLPAIGMNARGDAVIVWGVENPDPDSGHVDALHGLQWPAGEAPHAPRLLLAEVWFTGMTEVSVGVDGDGDSVLLSLLCCGFESSFPGGFAQRWSTSGALTTIAVVGGVVGPARQARVAINTAGDAVLTWLHSDQLDTLYGSRWPADGSPSSKIVLATGGLHEMRFLSASQVATRDGDAVITWINTEKINDDEIRTPFVVRSRAWSLASGAAPGPTTTILSSHSTTAVWLSASSGATRSITAVTSGASDSSQTKLHTLIDY